MTEVAGAPSASTPLPGPWRRWVLGARPRTLPAAIVPVAVGTAVAWWAWWHREPLRAAGVPHLPVWWRGGAALVVALALQVGVNYANDHADGVRGTDSRRVGPVRLVASGLVAPRAVARAAWLSFGVAGLAGVALAAATSWWLVAVGVLAVTAAWGYTGGPRPYGYLGLGELFVFAFFGVVATVGTTYVEVGSFPSIGLVVSVATGLLAVALLEANNLRDVEGDRRAGKRTLAVRLGRRRGGLLYVGLLGGVGAAVAVGSAWHPPLAVALAGLLLAKPAVRMALGPDEGRSLLPLLSATARLQLVLGALLVIGLLV